jgi:hypothetical protein
MAGAMFAGYDKAPYMERVRAFLARADETSAAPADRAAPARKRT